MLIQSVNGIVVMQVIVTVVGNIRTGQLDLPDQQRVRISIGRVSSQLLVASTRNRNRRMMMLVQCWSLHRLCPTVRCPVMSPAQLAPRRQPCPHAAAAPFPQLLPECALAQWGLREPASRQQGRTPAGERHSAVRRTGRMMMMMMATRGR